MNIIIIGGGAAGLMAAVTAARCGAAVTVLDRNDKPGRKLLASGNGRCNLTNVTQDPSRYRGEHPEFAWALISTFGLQETLRFFTKAGIYTKNKNGWIYPYSEQAASVLEVLRMEAEHHRVKVKTREEVVSVVPHEKGFEVATKTWKYTADKVIIAAGSPASAVAGSGDGGYQLAVSLGHSLVKPLPALVPLRCSGDYFTKWAGVRMECSAVLLVDNKEQQREKGEVQFTGYGLSGIPIFQFSRYAVRALDEGKTVSVTLDFMPEFTEDQLCGFLNSRLADCPYKSTEELLIGILPAKLIPVLCRDVGSHKELARQLKKYSVPVKSAHSLETAQVCSGGVNTMEVSAKTLESNLQQGVFFAGEILDVDGECGGYNLQWAWSSGAVAGAAAAVSEFSVKGEDDL